MSAELTLRLRVAGQGDIQAALQMLGAQAQQVAAHTAQLSEATAVKMVPTFHEAGRVSREFGTALAGAAAVGALFARSSPELQQQLEVVSLTLSAAGTSARALG